MKVRALIVAGIALTALAGCLGTVAPTPGAAPTSAQKEGDSTPQGDVVDAGTDVPSEAGVAPTPPPGEFAEEAKPHTGGVSALPSGWEGDEGKKSFDFTIFGEADPTCAEPATKDVSDFGGFAKVRYLATGNVGAVLLDGGETVDLLHCEVLVVHFQVGSGNTARCQDVSVDQNCHFSGLVSFYPGVDKPTISLFGRFFEHPKPVCGETQWLATPGQSDLPFLAATEKLPVCSAPAIDSSILSHFKMKLPAP